VERRLADDGHRRRRRAARAPRTLEAVTLAPAQRADLLLDLSDHARGARVQLRSLAFPPPRPDSSG
jgi:hypothetical protein